MSQPMEVDASQFFTTLHSSDSIPEGLLLTEMKLEEEAKEMGIFIFKLTDYSKTSKIPKFYTPHFSCAGRDWRLLFMARHANQISMYLDCTMTDDEAKVGIPAQMSFFLLREDKDDMDTDDKVVLDGYDDPRKLIRNPKVTNHRYNEKDRDWGFEKFIMRDELMTKDVGKRYIIDDSIVFGVAIKIIKDELGILWHNFMNYDSKKQTGYVGLKNQGATCYMNSILQSYFFTGVFRKSVFQIPVEGENLESSIPFALQKVFFSLMESDNPVGTTELTKSFGWDTMESFMQHDVQEFNRVLCDNLETKMKNTVVDGTISKLLEGKMKSFIKCINVDYESSRVESFYDIQLNVKGMKTLEESFENYIELETLDGDNKYHADKFGLQDAKKGVIFESFPPVLHLQLKRFEYDFMRDVNVKIHDRFEFPEKIDLTRFLANPEGAAPQVFHLHGVLVHSGDSHGGHYYVFVKTKPYGKWFKFDDDRVIPCYPKDALDENFGQDLSQKPATQKPISRFSKMYTSAYMLVYIRESDFDWVLCDVGKDDIPKQLRDNLEREKSEAEQKERNRNLEHNSINTYIVTDQILKHYHGKGLFPYENYIGKPITPEEEANIPAESKLILVKADKASTFEEYCEKVAEKLKVSPSEFRLWPLSKRASGEFRFTSEDAYDNDNKNISRIGMNVIYYVDFKPQVPTNRDKDEHVMLFLKFYDPERSQTSYVGKVSIKYSERLIELANLISREFKFSEDNHYTFYQESDDEVLKLNRKESIHKSKLKTGDIIIFQKELKQDEVAKYKLPTVDKYFSYESEKINVHFRSKANLKQEFTLIFHKKALYTEIANRAAQELKVDPNHLRFSNHQLYPEGPYMMLKYDPKSTLDSMLTQSYQDYSNILYYEKLDITIQEMEKLQPLNIKLLTKMREEAVFEILVPKGGTTEDVLKILHEKILASRESKSLHKDTKEPETTPPAATNTDNNTATTMEMDNEEKEAEKEDSMDISDEGIQSSALSGLQHLRILGVETNTTLQQFSTTDPVSKIASFTTLYAEEIPTEELEKEKDDKVVKVIHYQKSINYTHGIPFYFVLKKDEKLKDTIARLKKRANVSDKEWEKYKVSVIQSNAAKPLEDEDGNEFCLYNLEWNNATDAIGLDHPDKSLKGGKYAERAVVIRG